jgi:hypothetical protein
MKVEKGSLWIIPLVLIAGILACNTPLTATEVAPTPTTIPTLTSSTPTAAILHENIPVNLPQVRSSHAGDYDSSKTANEKRSPGGDRFTFTIFERPFNANEMDKYFSYLDIIDTFVFQDDIWIYGTLTLRSMQDSDPLSAQYAFELDMDMDGKGDWLAMTSTPSSTEWQVEGVRVFQDLNKDVGGSIARVTDDDGTAPGDGFEVKVFDSGEGQDADLAWSRIAPQDPNTIQIAVKRALFANDDKYMINMWAGSDLMDPALFDHSDHFTHAQAGAADPGFPIYYPIKEVYELDNACRMAVGFEATGGEAGICPELVIPGPGSPQGCTASQFASLICIFNGGSWNSKTCKCTPPTPIPPPN